MSREILVLGNVRQGSFVLFGSHRTEHPNRAPGGRPLVVHKHHDRIQLEQLRKMSFGADPLVYHAYLPTAQARAIEALWPGLARNRLQFADQGCIRTLRTVPKAFEALFPDQVFLAQDAWDLWVRAHEHATQWLGPPTPFTAYDLVLDPPPLPPVPTPSVSFRTTMKRLKRETIARLTRR